MAETIDVGGEKKSPNKKEIENFDLAVCGVEPVSLAKAVENARKFLNRGRTAAETSIAFVGQGIGVIRNLKNACFNDRKAGASLKKDAHTQTEQLIRQLSDVALDLTDGRGRKYTDILAHYRTLELSDDKTLAQEFENYRAEYVKNPTNGATCNRYGWMLHDCLKAAYDRLHNARLVEFFKKEFEAWHYQGPDKLRDTRIDECRRRDIKIADAFLDGPREALILLSAGEWEKAKKSAEEYIESNPGNAAAMDVVLKACEKIERIEDAVDMLNTSSAAVKWYPQEAKYQRWFIGAACRVRQFVYDLVTPQNANEWSSIARWGYGELIKQCCSDFSRLNLIEPGTAHYSQLMRVVVSSSEQIFPLRRQVRDLLEQLAPMVVRFVKLWGVNNFRSEDRETKGNARRRYSLAGRVMIMLMKYCEYGVNKDDLKWTAKVAVEHQTLFAREPSGFLNAAASFCHALGDDVRSRQFAIDLVRCNQAEGWRWTVLARTYPKGSQERSDCLIRAKSNREQENSLEVIKLLRDVIPVGGKKGETPQRPQKFPTREDYEEANRRAEQLLQGETSQIPGVIQTRFKDKVSQADMMRVWWLDSENGTACSDFVSFASATGLESAVAGDPVTVSVVEVGDRRKVVGVASRSNGVAWDIYPFNDAIVVAKNDARHFVKIMYAAGKTCASDPRKKEALTRLRVGDFCQVAVWEREGMPSVALDVKVPDAATPALPFCHEYKGVLRRMKGSRDGIVDDVVVPPEVRGKVYFETQVSGLAIMSGIADKPKWRAVTCNPIKDLEVLQ